MTHVTSNCGYLDPHLPLRPPVRGVLSYDERHHLQGLLLLYARPPQQ